jgi:hypothetical protein
MDARADVFTPTTRTCSNQVTLSLDYPSEETDNSMILSLKMNVTPKQTSIIHLATFVGRDVSPSALQFLAQDGSHMSTGWGSATHQKPHAQVNPPVDLALQFLALLHVTLDTLPTANCELHCNP